MKRGWYNEGWRHSLAARGIRSNYMARKSVDLSMARTTAELKFKSLINKRRRLQDEVNESRRGAKEAQRAKKELSEDARPQLEEIRKGFSEDRAKAQKKLEAVKQELEDLEPFVGRATILGADREERALRTDRAAEIQRAVKAKGMKDFQLSGLPTKGKVLKKSISGTGTRKVDAIISGKQGLKQLKEQRKKELEEIEAAEGLEIKQKPGPKLKPDEEKIGELVKSGISVEDAREIVAADKGKSRGRGRPKKGTTNKGRGRPKKEAPEPSEEEVLSTAESGEGFASVDELNRRLELKKEFNRKLREGE